MKNDQIEQEIQEKGKTAARITPSDIEDNISSEWYINAGDSVIPDSFQPPVPAQHPLRLLTFCVLVLKNGFTVTGESACASPENFNAEIERLESLGKINSATKHKYALQVLNGYKSVKTALEAIDLDYLKGLELHLRQRGNKDNSIATRFAIFKAIYNKAVKEGKVAVKQNPFSIYQVGSLWAKTRKRAIDKDDIQRLIDLEITEGHTTEYRRLAKDLFLFSYFT